MVGLKYSIRPDIEALPVMVGIYTPNAGGIPETHRIIAICIYSSRILEPDKMTRSATNWRAKILSALSDPTRLEIVEFLGDEERCVCEIVPAFGRAQSTISKHLAILHGAGILERRIDGKMTLYRIKNPRIIDLLREVDAIALDEITELKKAEEALLSSAG
ncbi:MAG: hypothetical protein METHAR1v1_570006 [Methanothrix sp.]|nr:MAG: hypothetical protein METHAR1v1_570006 [Methanothrix sp.]